MILFYFNQNCKFLERLIQVHKLLYLIGQGLWDALYMLFKNLPLHPWTCGKPKIHREHVHLVESCHIPGLVKGCIVIASYINEIIHAEHVCKPLLKKELYVWVDKLMRVKCLFRIYPFFINYFIVVFFKLYISKMKPGSVLVGLSPYQDLNKYSDMRWKCNLIVFRKYDRPTDWGS